MQLGSPTAGNFTVGGNGVNLFDYIAVTSPYERLNLFTRASYDLNDKTKVWATLGYSDVGGDYLLLPEMGTFQVKADNPFLTPTARAQLTALGATFPLTIGRILTDVGPEQYLHLKTDRQNKEGSIGIDGSLGGGWTYSAYYDHGELRNKQVVYNQRITANFNNAIDPVAGPGGVPICRANAVTITAPGCAPINLLGNGNISAAAVAYAFGAGTDVSTTKLDAGGIVFRAQPFSSWAGPVDIAFGADARREAIETNYIDPISLAGGRSTRNASPLDGKFDVKEGFGEINVPLLDIPDMLHVEANGAARYSDYSTSGGIWSWKYGATARVAHDLLARGTYSRDIRSPSINELYTKGTAGFANVQDPFVGQTQALVKNFAGGNPNLVPEIGHTLTLGGSYSPHYAPGLSFSLDYYDIEISGAIASISLQDTLTGCFARDPRDPTCGGVIARTPTGAIDSVQR
ncbi:MAG: TonB-dependent receptor, partial [Phenylobacterium sp.]